MWTYLSDGGAKFIGVFYTTKVIQTDLSFNHREVAAARVSYLNGGDSKLGRVTKDLAIKERQDERKSD